MLTSDCATDQREQIIEEWDAGKIYVLASTYCIGLDDSKVKQVILMSRCWSAADALQRAGPNASIARVVFIIKWQKL